MKNTEEILEQYGLDFTIQKVPLIGELNGVAVETPYFGLVNSKSQEFIHQVKKGYTPSQNVDIVDAVLKGMRPFGDDLSVSNAGSLNGGRKVFMQLAINGVSSVGDDSVKRYVTIIDSNDGSTSLGVGIGDFTMSCSNQFYHFYKGAQNKFRHTASIEEKIIGLPLAIEEALSRSLRMIELYNKMASTPLTKGLADQLVQQILQVDRTLSMDELADMSTKKSNAMDSLYENIAKEISQKGDNLWGLHSGVTRWTTHEKSAPRRDNGRLESMMTSTNYKTNQSSLEFALSQL